MATSKLKQQQALGTYSHPIQGFLINGKIVTSVTSNNLTVAIKNLAGNDPSVADPVIVRIGDTVRSITSALSVTKNAGTNWMNSGSTELATIEVDYFVYLGYNSTDGVVLGFARFPTAVKYGDFHATNTNEKYAAISTITNAAAGDVYENIGRFNAILSATASFNWSIPGTSIIITKPTYFTRQLSFTTVWGGFSANPTGAFKYKILYDLVFVEYADAAAGTSNSTSFTFTLPMAPLVGKANFFMLFIKNNGTNQAQPGHLFCSAGSRTINVYTSFYQGAFTGSSTKDMYFDELVYQY